MRIALAQINSWLGDFAANYEKILNQIARAQERHCDLIIFPEAALFGYHPCDLLERPSIVAEQLKFLKKLQQKLPKGIAVLVGAIGHNTNKEGKPYQNAAVFLERGQNPKWFAKQLLPTYDVFDEGRHIEPGQVAKNVLHWKGKKILITICEDIWAWPHPGKSRSASYRRNPLKDVKKPIDLVLNLSASPFATTKIKNRMRVVKSTAAHFKCPMVYVNMVGAQDELIFDGASFAINSKGKVVSQCSRFIEDINIFDMSKQEGGLRPLPDGKDEIHRQAIVLGIRDFVHKNGFQKVHLGLSGGIDSAVVACLAVDALGAHNVTGIAMPGPYSAPESLELAEQLASNIGIHFLKAEITQSYQHLLGSLDQSFGKTEFGVVQENLQARLRGVFLMAFANRERSLLLATSNKSELATGYSTLYGDMCGGLVPIGDLLKSEVYGLANLYNQEIELIPRRIIDRPPSAELRPNQKDQDSLPEYSELDPIVEKLVEGFSPARTATEKRVLNMMMNSEFKRWQAAPILKVSNHAFGRGRRFPLAHKARI